MDITYNKVDETPLPISTNRVSASEYNQIAGSLMHIITTAGFTPDSQNNAQLLNALKQAVVNFPYITETYHNGTEWYRVWSDGWCEQGGQSYTYASATTTTFLKPFIDTNYTILTNIVLNGNSAYHIVVYQKNTSDFTTYYYQAQSRVDFSWKAEGYIS